MARTPILITPETAAALLEARKEYDAAKATAEAKMIAAVSDAVDRGEVTIQAAGPLVGIPRDRLSQQVKDLRAGRELSASARRKATEASPNSK